MLNNTPKATEPQFKSVSETALLLTFNQIVSDIINQEPSLTSAAHGFISNITNLVLYREEPGAYFKYIGHGAFKECYETGIPGWVIKFCSNNNETDIERQVIDLSTHYGCKELFIPTYFVAFPFSLNPTHLADGSDVTDYTICSSGDSVNDERLVSCQIQPKIRIAADTKWTPLQICEEDYVISPILYNTGGVIPLRRLTAAHLENREWIIKAIAAYGDEVFDNFLDFSRTIQLSDLHEGNLGYLHDEGGERPVIIDWLSFIPR